MMRALALAVAVLAAAPLAADARPLCAVRVTPHSYFNNCGRVTAHHADNSFSWTYREARHRRK